MSARLVITRRLELDYGHRLLKHEGKCRNYHGHRATIEVTVSAAGLDEVGRVIDFGAVKDLVGARLDALWDHGMILEKGDPLIGPMKEAGTKVCVVDYPPTVEHLARAAFLQAREVLPADICVECVRFWETPNCWAEFSRVDD